MYSFADGLHAEHQASHSLSSHGHGWLMSRFQIHKAACEKAGEYVKGDPEKTLNNCDIYQSTNAGNALKEVMAMGSSKPWPDALEVLTGQRKMSADALLEYFQPLYDWLVKENKALGASVGWEANLSKF
ncbi:AGAP009753-PA-like protein [Anopheles sinensis]|uniref:AGAP009753-PA-like protein n=1 Tax=Anopheles sinensis TaxID=74873 RepID=A0A084W1S4_ANOSI|nr:AGAP009753-PA-like protein [Anopheles sinensis]